jgi:uncharacterized membrane protein
MLKVIAILLIGQFSYAQDLSFERDIKPIMTNNCVKCHAGVTNYETVFKQKDKIYSKLVKKREMPPKYSMTISDAEVNLIKRWIEQGAKK